MGVSKNDGTPKSSILIGISIINHPFWGAPIFGNTHIYEGASTLADVAKEIHSFRFLQKPVPPRTPSILQSWQITWVVPLPVIVEMKVYRDSLLKM